MITKQDILMGRDAEYPLTQALHANLDTLLMRLNTLESICPFPLIITSGYRPGRFNRAAHGAKSSAHLTCEAADIKDIDQNLRKWISYDKLQDVDLYLESPDFTPTWIHLQTRRTKSGNRIFSP